MLAESGEQQMDAPPPKAMIVPHAGYRFSGHTAAAAYARLHPLVGTVTRVVLLGPAHRVAIQGLALPAKQAFATPLGTIEVDQMAVRALAGLPQVIVNDAAHAREHSLEVQLPFLQCMFRSFKLVPLVVGNASNEQVSEVLDRLWGGPETLIVISSDLSHYHPYAQAQLIDRETIQRILLGVQLYSMQQACGAIPINGMLLAAKHHGLEPQLISQCNSGDRIGDRERVVGYASVIFAEPLPGIGDSGNSDRGEVLLSIARSVISSTLGRKSEADESAEWLREEGAVFVTLTKNGQLRGCVGSLEPHRQLLADIKANAEAAATRDRRFPPVTLEELPNLQVEVSLLSRKQPIAFTSEMEALQQLQAGLDGIIFECDRHRATFLPQVWEKIPDPRAFMAHLKVKAGLPADFWSDSIRLYRYRVEKWAEKPHQKPN